ncbi:TIGR03560 family F420-dependent LLM class oxidoreductase [Amycolatopsis eburnea]|uniref:TIGR03560 family F420-dependent LLM class oxidoreductase n=1 Tax=Amycolatopsis eburnea TaxID=2267691 RepID=A0A427T7M9_9PSEU|nr:TIGR03560 family F420-dependent LLM class oxidoreductase [Amycolatopsis eburnea]RSD16356.1 TIGR03560 family F420-dependent LLM class oxidoreductase [Amycolatopsis eburnea]
MELFISMEAHLGASYDDQVHMARLAEELGFGGVFRSDHFFVRDPHPLGTTDAWLTLAGLARETSRVRLGSLMTAATFRPPALLAVAVAQVDAMSSGRAELGLGAGWHEAEHRAMGAAFRTRSERFEALEEQLRILHLLWSQASTDAKRFVGRYYSIEDNPGLPRPIQVPRPPIVVGGRGGLVTPRLAARYADEHNLPMPTVADAKRLFDQSARECDEIGRDPGGLRRSVLLRICCGSTESEAQARAKRWGWTDPSRHIVGTSSMIADAVEHYVRLGVSRTYCQVVDFTDLDHIQLVAAEVLPVLRAAPHRHGRSE